MKILVKNKTCMIFEDDLNIKNDVDYYFSKIEGCKPGETADL
jgi:hypothetical protein